MTDLFNLWNYFQYSDQLCAFDVTMANMPRMKDGTSEWIKACLAAFDLEVSVSTWEVKPFRSHYFSDDPNRKDWRDRWPVAWNVRVVTEDHLPSSLNRLSDLPKRIETSDTSWDYGFVDPSHNSTAMLIANYQDGLVTVEMIAQEIVARGKLKDGPINKSEIEIRSLTGGMQQLRILFGEIVFPNNVDTLESLVEICRQHGGRTNWTESVS